METEQLTFENAKQARLAIEPRDLAHRMKRGRFFLLLDVRPFDQYLNSHIQGAHCIPLPQLRSKLHQLSRLTQIAVCCQDGGSDCLEALKILQEAGFQRVHYLRGGFDAWISQVEPDLLATVRRLS